MADTKTRAEITSLPPLPRSSFTRTHSLSKVGHHGGWGLVLRGTTCELEGNLKVYTCQVEDVTEGGEAQEQGIQKGDQIASIDDIQVRDLDHSRVVKLFQLRDKLKLTILPSHMLTLGQQIRVTKYNSSSVHSIWALMNNLCSLEIIGINLSKCGVFLGTLISLKSLSLCHCSLSSLVPLRGLQMLKRVNCLSLAHNYLADDTFTDGCGLHHLTNLKKLDLSRNLLSVFPDVLYKLTRLEVLVIVDNNLSTIPDMLASLTSLHTLCLDGNLINDVDNITRSLPSLCKLSISDNRLECEPEVIKNGHYLITGIEKNPYTRSQDDPRSEPTLRRTLSVRGPVFMKRHELTISN